MNPLFQAGLEFQQFIQEKKWRFCFIGGLAVIRWGEVRVTQDVDLSLLSGFGNEDTFVHSLLSQFKSRISDAEEFALKSRVLLLSASNGVAVDISLAGLPFEEEMIERATPFSYAPDCSLITCSAEDLVVLKAFANRRRDWLDIEGILVRQASGLEFEYITDRLTPLCELKDAPEIIEKFHHLVDEI
ncbi:MAG: hypothetical protein OXT74_05360 [Candidatus Poribacteria bacterium]|nr:hypothetical protein [Candidatus Poribacteria bacterium]